MSRNDGKSVLLGYLSAQRKHVLGILDGVDDEQVRRPVLPSGRSCLGLVQHLTLDVERFWFSAVAAGDQVAVDFDEADPASAWIVTPDTPAATVLDAYRAEIERSDAVLEALPPPRHHRNRLPRRPSGCRSRTPRR